MHQANEIVCLKVIKHCAAYINSSITHTHIAMIGVSYN